MPAYPDRQRPCSSFAIRPASSRRVRPAAARAEVTKAWQGFADSTFNLYKGPLKDNEGNVVLKEGEVIDNEDNGFKLKVKFLVEGAIGRTGLK